MSEISETELNHPHDDRTELEKVLANLRPWFEKNGTTVIYGLAAVLAVTAVIIYLQRQPAGDPVVSNSLLGAALSPSPEAFQDVADLAADSPVATWARLRQAERQLATGMGNMFTNRSVGIEELEQAETAFNRVLSESGGNVQLGERAIVGLATIKEALCDGSRAQLDEAIALWQSVVDDFEASGLYAEHAKDRIYRLQQDDAERFYKAFAAFNPEPAETLSTPGDGEINIPGIPGASDLMPPEVPEIPPTIPGETPEVEGDAGANSEDAAPEDAAPEGTDGGGESAAAPLQLPPTETGTAAGEEGSNSEGSESGGSEATEPEATEPEATEPEATEPEATGQEAGAAEASSGNGETAGGGAQADQ